MTGDKQSFDPRSQPDELIDRLVQDPNRPHVKKLVGFRMGKSNLEENWRLYMTEDLNHYVEVPKDAVLHAEQVNPTKTIVWVNPGAEVKETIVRAGRVDFLRGTIIEDHLRRRPGTSTLPGRMFAMAGEPRSGCAHTGCSAGCTEGYGCGGGEPNTVGFTCGC